ncbi:unnamed protein product [Effrenium voratum]|nr:unnamed protein product [Effrenium voratum]CAJ1433967.1 unnamed protein product [Effrenium voratum]
MNLNWTWPFGWHPFCGECRKVFPVMKLKLRLLRVLFSRRPLWPWRVAGFGPTWLEGLAVRQTSLDWRPARGKRGVAKLKLCFCEIGLLPRAPVVSSQVGLQVLSHAGACPLCHVQVPFSRCKRQMPEAQNNSLHSTHWRQQGAPKDSEGAGASRCLEASWFDARVRCPELAGEARADDSPQTAASCHALLQTAERERERISWMFLPPSTVWPPTCRLILCRFAVHTGLAVSASPSSACDTSVLCLSFEGT